MLSGLEIGGIRVATRFASEFVPPFQGPYEAFAGFWPTADLILDVKVGGHMLKPAKKILFDAGGLYRVMQLSVDEARLEIYNQAESRVTPYLCVEWNWLSRRGILSVAENLHGLGTRFHPMVYPLDELLWIQLLSDYSGLILHAFGCAIAGRGYAFCGTSGAGKSTLARLFSRNVQQFQNAPVLLSDDRLILKRELGGFVIYGSPWHGDAEICSPKKAELEAIFLISHGKQNKLRRLSGAAAMTALLVRTFPALYRADAMEKNLELLADLLNQLPVYELDVVPDHRLIEFLNTELGFGLQTGLVEGAACAALL